MRTVSYPAQRVGIFMNQEPIFLLGAHKSGTSLLRSLFDGHSQLYAVPFETHYFRTMRYWSNYGYRSELPRRLNTQEIVNNFCRRISKANNPKKTSFGDSGATGLFNEMKFREIFSSVKESESDKERIERYFEAIYFALTGASLPESKRIVEKSVENAEFAIELAHSFPAAKFIHIIRNPYANIVSLRKFNILTHGFPSMPGIIKSLNTSYYYLYKNQRMIENYLVIKYEDLVTLPEKKIREICEFLGITFEESLLAPTFLGKSWKGNSTTGKSFNAIEGANVDIWKSEIHPMETRYINALFPFIITDYNYETVAVRGSWLWRARGENILKYLYNRFYNWYI